MGFQTTLTRLAAASALALAAVGAHADTYDFTLSSGGQTLTWQMASSPTPDEAYSPLGFGFDNFMLSSTNVELDFYSDLYGYGGGLMIRTAAYGMLSIYSGPQLYSGSENAPTFKLGSFELNGVWSNWTYFNSSIANSTLTISSPLAAVPEPATVALMLAGVGLVGGAAARRRKAGQEDAAVA